MNRRATLTMAKRLFVTPLLATLLFTGQAASEIVFQSATSAATFSPVYSAEWFTFVDQESLPKIRDWGTQGNMGYWLGIGFGSSTMVDSDIIMCAFRYTGQSSNDQFSCFDFHANEEGAPALDEIDNIVDISTTTTFGTDVVTLTATFERLLDTYQADDYKIKKSSTIDGIWAHGFIASDEMQYHGFANDQRGAFRMFVPTYSIPDPVDTGAFQGAMVGMVTIMFGLLALFI
ncbi:hypothetical protein FGO68_gene12215 [Halteria grandinella]|uniref:DOMON domain-containing protein n=1 Tax=Halteria grandinella TaxID=5974 RepID=A0A8J8NK06_HALGN|nr:hypothetical protein FGO68_gene12215 [Halteria grandinella]